MTDSLRDWAPFYLKHGEVHWGYVGQERFVEPFFQDTLQKLARRPFNQLLRQRTGLDTLTERASSHPGLPLQGLIFHLSRCGSTLVAQALSALNDSVVLSEPEPVDTLLQWLAQSPHYDPAAGHALLRDLLAALGQPRRPEDRRLFIKTDAWHIRHIDRLLAAFPETPWIFLYRDPVEVLVSQFRIPGLFLIPGTLTAHGFHPPAELPLLPLQHGAWIMGQILQDAEEAMRKYSGGLLINYQDLPDALETRIAQHLGLELDPSALTAMRARYTQNAKSPNQTFNPDSDSKHAEANDEIRALTAQWLDAPYGRLETIRKEQPQEPPGA